MRKLNYMLSLYILFFCSSAYATDEIPLQPAYNFQITYALEGTTRATVAMVAGKSYECVVFRTFIFDVDGPFGNYFVYLSGTTPSNANMNFTYNGDRYPFITAVEAYNSSQAFSRFSYTAVESGLHTLTMQDQSGLSSSTGDISMDCRETTLYGSFNRFFAGVAIIELENRSRRDIPVKISITDSSGAVLVDNQSFVASKNTRSDAIFSDLPSQSLGQITITHEAPSGALSGTVAEYDFNADNSITLKRERPLRTAMPN